MKTNAIMAVSQNGYRRFAISPADIIRLGK